MNYTGKVRNRSPNVAPRFGAASLRKGMSVMSLGIGFLNEEPRVKSRSGF